MNNTEFTSGNKNAFVVDKKVIKGSGDYNLSVDRYRVNENLKQSNFEMLPIEDLIENVKYTNKIQKSEFKLTGKFPIIDQSENFIAGYWDDIKDVYNVNKPLVIFGDHTRIFKYIDFDFVLGADGVKILQPKEIINPNFFYYCLQNLEIVSLGYSRHYKELKSKKIPLPPLSIQQQIVDKIESYQKRIEEHRISIQVEEQKIKDEINKLWKPAVKEYKVEEEKVSMAAEE